MQISPTTGLPRTPKFCMICFKNGKPPNPSVYTTHNTAACNAFSTADRREMLAALQAMDLSDDYAINEEETEGQETNFEGQEPASHPHQIMDLGRDEDAPVIVSVSHPAPAASGQGPQSWPNDGEAEVGGGAGGKDGAPPPRA